MIDSYLQSKTEMDDHAIHLLFSANRWEKSVWIKDTIAEGYTIICDRYAYSGMVYSAAKNNIALDIGWARQCDEGLPRPDLVLFLNLDLKEAERRGGYGEEKYEKREMQERVKELFGALRYAKGDECVDMVTVDAGDEIDKVAELVWTQALIDIEEVQNGRAGKLRTIKPWDQGIVRGVLEFQPRNTAKPDRA